MASLPSQTEKSCELNFMATYRDRENVEAVNFFVNLETPRKWRLLKSQELLSMGLTALTLCKLRHSSYKGIFVSSLVANTAWTNLLFFTLFIIQKDFFL